MEENRKIGVYVCDCGSNIGGKVNVPDVVEFAQQIPTVTVAREYKFMCSGPGQELIEQDIRNMGLNRVVVASCSPQMHEPTFRRLMVKAGLNPYLFEMANIREHDSWVTDDPDDATEKAKVLVSAAVSRVYYQEPLETKEVPVNPNTLVVGGGVAGIQAALEVADSGHKVYLVEREPSIGGHMIQLDKTFPTLDCSACILTPKMTLAGSHPDIELMSYSEVAEVSGFIGNFKVKIKQKPRYVDVNECNGCSDCENVCPVTVPSEFNMNIGTRKAIYRPFPQAVPSAFVIDKQGKSPCSATCPAGVNAHGYIALISQGKFSEALEVLRRTMPFAGVCGRVCSHPCESECERGNVDQPVAIRSLKRFIADYQIKHGNEPVVPCELTKTEKVAVVGSGPAGIACAYDLIKLGYPVTVFEAAEEAGGMLRYGIPEYRLPKEILDIELQYVKDLGVDIRTSSPVKNLEELKGQGYKAVFLANGAWTSQKMNIPGEDSLGVLYAIDFLKKVIDGVKVEPGNSVAVVGGGNAAIDAARTAVRLGAKAVSLIYRRTRAEMPALSSEIDQMEQEGVKISYLATPVEVKNNNGKVTGITCLRMELGEPDESGRRRPVPVEGSEFEMKIDTLILATGQAVNTGRIPAILNLSSNGTISVDPVTYQTSQPGVFAGGDVVAGPATVIEAVAAGKESAISINRYIQGMDMAEGRPEERNRVRDITKKNVEKKPRAEAELASVAQRTTSFIEVEEGLTEEQAVAEASRCLNCAVCSECLACVSACERNAIHHEMKEEIVEIEVGNIIIATGFKEFDPTPITQYGYGRLDNVITGMEFERIVSSAGPTGGHILMKNGQEPKSIALVHCVGSRDSNYHEYCSAICCMYAMKFSHLLREHLPGAEVYEFYIDVRAPRKGFEEFYNRILKEGTIMYRGRPGEITDIAETPEEEGKLIVKFENSLIGEKERLPVDMVILCTALEAHDDAHDLGRIFNISSDGNAFFIERHPKLDPVATMTDGVFIAGCCESPKDIHDSVAQASAAAARVLALISKGKVDTEATIAEIDEARCSGCRVCNLLCPYSAISFIEEEKVSRINDAICKGCGACVAACPSAAIKHKHYTSEEIMAQIEGILI